ncbi:MAG: TrmH family RNA methyltransferase [Anaerolineae bacterium]|nr:TrmH family RNA methyltransferase [Anaerolineae bacterium]
MSTVNNAGKQLDNKTLFERQKAFREAGDLLPGPVVVALGLTVPENHGMVLRLADAAGASRVIFVNEQAPIRARLRKTARNADNLVPWQVVSIASFMQEIETLAPLIAVELTTQSTNLFTTQLPKTCTLVVGSEQYGIADEVLEKCQSAVHIPLYGVNSSMNVTHALAIALFEWRRKMSISMIAPYTYPKDKKVPDSVTLLREDRKR